MQTAKEVMSSPVERIEESASVEEALRRMRARRVTSLLVPPADPEDAPGFISESDIVTKVVAEGLALGHVTVRAAMSRPIISVPPETSVEDCARLLRSAEVRRVLVDDGDDVIGIVSTSDILDSIVT